MFKPGGGAEDFKAMLHTLRSRCTNVELMKNETFTVVSGVEFRRCCGQRGVRARALRCGMTYGIW